MRSHSQIVRDHGAANLHRDLKERGRDIHVSTPQRWAERNSIPGPFWADLADLGVASLDELAQSARPAANDTPAQESAA